jgi:hypothetical protein
MTCRGQGQRGIAHPRAGSRRISPPTAVILPCRLFSTPCTRSASLIPQEARAAPAARSGRSGQAEDAGPAGGGAWPGRQSVDPRPARETGSRKVGAARRPPPRDSRYRSGATVSRDRAVLPPRPAHAPVPPGPRVPAPSPGMKPHPRSRRPGGLPRQPSPGPPPRGTPPGGRDFRKGRRRGRRWRPAPRPLPLNPPIIMSICFSVLSEMFSVLAGLSRSPSGEAPLRPAPQPRYWLDRSPSPLTSPAALGSRPGASSAEGAESALPSAPVLARPGSPAAHAGSRLPDWQPGPGARPPERSCAAMSPGPCHACPFPASPGDSGITAARPPPPCAGGGAGGSPLPITRIDRHHACLSPSTHPLSSTSPPPFTALASPPLPGRPCQPAAQPAKPPARHAQPPCRRDKPGYVPFLRSGPGGHPASPARSPGHGGSRAAGQARQRGPPPDGRPPAAARPGRFRPFRTRRREAPRHVTLSRAHRPSRELLATARKAARREGAPRCLTVVKHGPSRLPRPGPGRVPRAALRVSIIF